VYNVIMILT